MIIEKFINFFKKTEKATGIELKVEKYYVLFTFKSSVVLRYAQGSEQKHPVDHLLVETFSLSFPVDDIQEDSELIGNGWDVYREKFFFFCIPIETIQSVRYITNSNGEKYLLTTASKLN